MLNFVKLIAGALIHSLVWSLYREPERAVESTMAKPTALGRFCFLRPDICFGEKNYAKINSAFPDGDIDCFNSHGSGVECSCSSCHAAGWNQQRLFANIHTG